MATRLSLDRLGTRVAPLVPLVAVVLAVGDVHRLIDGWEVATGAPWHRALALGAAWSLGLVVGIDALRRLPTRVLVALLPTAAFLAWALLSSAVGDDPRWSVFIWVGFASLAAAGLAIARRGVDVALMSLLAATSTLVGVSLIAAVFSDDAIIATTSRLAGLASEPNTIGQIGGLLIVVGVVVASRAPSPLPVIVITAPAGLAAVVFSETRTAAAAVVVGVLVHFWSRAPWTTLLAAAVAGALMIGPLQHGDIVDDIRRGSEGSFSELNGRDRIWDLSVDLIVESPALGAGLGSGPAQFDLRAAPAGLTITSPSSHNLALEIAREVGLIGLALAVAAVVVARPWAARPLRPVLAYLLVTAITMPATAVPGVIALTWFVLIAAGALSSPGVHSTAMSAGRQESVGSSRGTDGRRLPLYQP